MEKVLEIIGVGLAMNELQYEESCEGCEIIRGTATIISKIVDDEEEFYDEFNFTYNIDEDLLDVDIEQDIWKDYIFEIEDILLENIKTNVLNNRNN